MAVYQDNEKQKAVCPMCGQEYSGYPATSRVDNITAICPECGTREALAAAVNQVWTYVGEIIFNMIVLVGTVKMSDRVVKEMMGL